MVRAWSADSPKRRCLDSEFGAVTLTASCRRFTRVIHCQQQSTVLNHTLFVIWPDCAVEKEKYCRVGNTSEKFFTQMSSLASVGSIAASERLVCDATDREAHKVTWLFANQVRIMYIVIVARWCAPGWPVHEAGWLLSFVVGFR